MAATSKAAAAWLPGDGSTVQKYVYAAVANMTIKKEGEGNGKKWYTCGPSASRNVAMAVYDHKTGSYRDFGEAQWADWEGTTTDGTARANVASALTHHLDNWGSWTSTRPTSQNNLMSWVITDTLSYGRPIVMNVSTASLTFWNGHSTGHFDFVYGFDRSTSTSRLNFAEEWDPVYIYGRPSSYGNPYGVHTEKLSNAYDAVTGSSIHGIVG